MTEEKENCIFQQNYNVLGLDDKPCCYLYHKYCDEIDSCYFKRCKRLEQENRELKEEIQFHNKENSNLLAERNAAQIGYDEIREVRERYRSALEEIKSIAQDAIDRKFTSNSLDYSEGQECIGYYVMEKINEVLGND